MAAITINVNGKQQAVDVSPDMPLLWVLRDTLGLTGTKFGCGMSLCGACTVHINGEAVRSCVTPLSAAMGKPVRTIEALGTVARPHPLQKAWVAHQVPQCGYCQSGMLMAAAALIDKNANPSDADIDAAITNICRCGTYPRIREAIKTAAKELRGVAPAAKSHGATSPIPAGKAP